MKNNYVKLCVILDRSGSMSTCVQDMEGGFNSFVEKQRLNNVGQFDVSLYQFDTFLENVYKDVPIDKVQKLKLEPRGSTALVDSVCTVIDELGKELSETREEDRPSKVIVQIITDGGENASLKFTQEDLKERIKRQTEQYNWDFIFMGANIDTWSVAQSYGITLDKTLSFVSQGKNKGISTSSLYSSFSDKMCAVRSAVSAGDTASIQYTFEEQQQQEELIKNNQ